MTSRVLFASQLGAGSGHLHVAAAVRAAIEAQGGRCDLALRDPAAAQRLRSLADAPVLPAPDHRMPARRLPPAACWAEALLAAGLETTEVVTGLVAGWLGLIDALQPDRLVTEYCPVAILAGRIRGLSTRSIGSGFTVPPAQTPMPTLQPWRTLPPERFEAAEARILAAFNGALECFDAAPIAQLAELYPEHETRLLNFPELDHYGVREAEFCLGPVGPVDAPAAAAFPGGDEPALLAYYHPSLGRTDAVAAWLERFPYRTLLVAPGLSQADRRALSAGSISIVDHQIDLEAALAEADLAVMHGGEGSVARALLSGTPLVLIPQHLEQGLLAHRLEAQQLAASVWMPPDRSLPDPESLLERLRQPTFRAARERFLARHGGHDVDAARAALGRWLLA